MANEDAFGYDDNTPSSGLAGEIERIGVLQVGKRKYAIGLQWEGIDDDVQEKPVQVARRASSKHGADFYCLREGQVGLGFRKQGHDTNMPSLAAHVASQRGGSFLAIYEVPGGYYLVGVRNDRILSECDDFYSHPEDARSAFTEFQGYHLDWDALIAPASLDIPGTVDEDIQNVVQGKAKIRLRPARASSALFKLLAGTLILGLGTFGVVWYLNYQQELADLEFQRALEQAAAQVGLGEQKQEIEIPPMPWEGYVLAVPFLESCVNDILAFPTDVPGWKVSNLSCYSTMGGASANASVERDTSLGMAPGGGSINWIKTSLKSFLDERSGSVALPGSGSANRVVVSWNYNSLPKIPVDLKTERVAKMRAYVLEHLEERMIRVNFADADSNDFWRGFSFSFSTGENPMLFADIIGNLPGAILTNVSFSLSSMQWQVEGKVYEQLQF